MEALEANLNPLQRKAFRQRFQKLIKEQKAKLDKL
jgi:hypothetical protein